MTKKVVSLHLLSMFLCRNLLSCAHIAFARSPFDAEPLLHADGDRYGVQSATCYKCLDEFCSNVEGYCQDDWDSSVEYCPCCEKYLCHQCCPVFVCAKCDETISCEDCCECEWCSADDCSAGPFCSKCARTELRYKECCDSTLCGGCQLACFLYDSEFSDY